MAVVGVLLILFLAVGFILAYAVEIGKHRLYRHVGGYLSVLIWTAFFYVVGFASHTALHPPLPY